MQIDQHSAPEAAQDIITRTDVLDPARAGALQVALGQQPSLTEGS